MVRFRRLPDTTKSPSLCRFFGARSIAQGDWFSISIQEDGDTERITLFENYVANRSPDGSVELGPTLPDLNKLFVTGSETATLPGVLECGGKRSATPLWLRFPRQINSAVHRLPGFATGLNLWPNCKNDSHCCPMRRRFSRAGWTS